MRNASSLTVIGFIQLMHMKVILVCILWYSVQPPLKSHILGHVFSAAIQVKTNYFSNSFTCHRGCEVGHYLCCTVNMRVLPYQFRIRKWKGLTEVPFCFLRPYMCKFSDFSVFVASQTFPLDPHNQTFIKNT